MILQGLNQCPGCGDWRVRVKPNGPHQEVRCLVCNRYIKFASRADLARMKEATHEPTHDSPSRSPEGPRHHLQ